MRGERFSFAKPWSQLCFTVLVATTICLIVVASTTLAFLIFSGGNNGSFTSARTELDSTIVHEATLSSVASGTQIASRVDMSKLNTSADCYIRVRVTFGNGTGGTLSDNQKVYLQLINSYELGTKSTSGYHWSRNFGGSYYLLDNTGALLRIDSVSVYSFADIGGILMPDISSVGGGWTVVDTLSLTIVAEAIRADYLTSSSLSSVIEYFDRSFDIDPAQVVQVCFDSAGGSLVDSLLDYSNTTIDLPTAPTRTGYTFDGWYYEKSCVTAYLTTDTFLYDTVLYAKWTEV